MDIFYYLFFLCMTQERNEIMRKNLKDKKLKNLYLIIFDNSDKSNLLCISIWSKLKKIFFCYLLIELIGALFSYKEMKLKMQEIIR